MKRGCFDNLLFAVLALVAFGASTYFWFNFFIRGKSVPTPNLVGKSLVDARALASDLGIRLVVDRNADRNADRIPVGAVAWQNRTPGATSYVKRGAAIRVGLSLGPLILRVPDLAGQTPGTAVLRLGQQNLRVGNVTYVDNGGNGIIAEDPPQQTVVAAQTSVSLLVGAPPAPPQYIMPDLIDQPLDQIRPAMESKGLMISNVKFESYPGIADGIIIRQFPLRGAPVSARDAITVVVSRADENAIVEQPPAPRLLQ